MARKKKQTEHRPVAVQESDAFDLGYDDQRWFDRSMPVMSQIGSKRPYWLTTIDDRAEGRWLPIYETEYDLSEIRAKGRALANLVAMAVGAQSALANYIFGNGLSFKVQSDDEEQNVDLVEDVQLFIDKVLDDNDFTSGERPGLDREIHDRSREDGEAIIALFPLQDGESVRFKVIDSPQLTEPLRSRELEDWLYSRGMLADELSYWKFGVHTRFDPTMNCEDIDNPLGYHIVYNALGSNWDYLPAEQIVHVKRNVGRGAKRGVSDYYAIWRMIEREEKLVTNIAEGSAVQAAIAFIREHVEGATRDGITAVSEGNATTQVYRSTATSTKLVSREQMRPGTVKDIPAGMKYHAGPLGTPGTKVFIEAVQLLMRVCGIRWNMPEYMISGDASNANFSSTLVSESPFVKAREADQQFYKGVARTLIWKAIQLSFNKGRFNQHGMQWDEFEAAIEVKVDAPAVASRDGLKAAQEAEILNKNGILSQRTWAAQANLNYDDEVKNGAEKVQPPAPAALPQAGQPPAEQKLGEPAKSQQEKPQAEKVKESFCATGPGGGIDPRCSPSDGSGESVDNNHLAQISTSDTKLASSNLRGYLKGKSYAEKIKARHYFQDRAKNSPEPKSKRHYAKLARIATASLSESDGGAHIAGRPFVIQRISDDEYLAGAILPGD